MNGIRVHFEFLLKFKIILFIITIFLTSFRNINGQDTLKDKSLPVWADQFLINSLDSNNQHSFRITEATSSLLILPIGNSITFDKRSNDPRLDGDKPGYRLPLFNHFNESGLNFNFIGSEKSGWNFLPNGYEDNAGFPGIKDDELAFLLQTGVRNQPPDFLNDTITDGPYLETFLPDVVLLHIGTNGNDLPNGTNASDVEDILNEVDRVESLFNKEIPVVVARIIDRVPMESYVTEFNDNVDSMVTDRVINPANPSYPDNIFIVDMEDSANIIYAIDSMGTIGNGILGDMNDKLHPNDKGHAKMAQVWYDAISNLYPNPVTIVVQPSSINTLSGLTASFSIQITSSETVSFQWKKNGEIILGATDSTYTTSPLTHNDNLSEYVCEINSNLYTINSDTATLIITDSTSRVTANLIAQYDFNEGEGTSIINQVLDYPDLDLSINDTSGVNWIPYGLQVISDPGIFTITPAKDIYDLVTETNEITLESWIIPDNDTLVGPARIITFSENTGVRNFTLGQQADSFEVRLRTTETTENGKPSIYSTPNSVSDKLTHLVYTRSNEGIVNLFIDGELNFTDTVSGNFSSWDSTFTLGLSDEITGDRLWLGKFYLAGIYNRALSSFEVLHNYNIKFNGFNNLLKKPTNLTGLIQNMTDIVLNWEDNSTEELGYIIERRVNMPDSIFTIIDSVGNNVASFLDSTKKYDSSYVYRVKAFNEYYLSDYSDEISVGDIPVSIKTSNLIADKFYLYQNYPNPFNPTTRITFSIERESKVQLKIFNAIGQVVYVIHDKEILSNGTYTSIFNGYGLASGVYFYRLIAKPMDGSATFVQINKAVLIK